MKAVKILIVDPQQDIIDHLTHFLRSHHYKVTGSTTDPEEVIGLCRDHHFDLAFIAHSFKAQSGFEICAEIHKLFKNLYMIIMKPDVSDQDIVLARHAHVQAFISKPFADCILLATMNQYEISRRTPLEET